MRKSGHIFHTVTENRLTWKFDRKTARVTMVARNSADDRILTQTVPAAGVGDAERIALDTLYSLA